MKKFIEILLILNVLSILLIWGFSFYKVLSGDGTELVPKWFLDWFLINIGTGTILLIIYLFRYGK